MTINIGITFLGVSWLRPLETFENLRIQNDTDADLSERVIHLKEEEKKE